MDQEDPELGLSAGEPPRKQQPAGRDDEAEEVAEGQEEEDAGDGEEEGTGEDLQDSSDEDEGAGNEYDVTDRFLVADDAAEDDEDGEEEGGDGATKRRKKRRRRREEEEELDEEDYELIGQRPPRREERKRIRKLTQPTAAGRQHVSAEDIREELFGKDDDDDDLQDVDEEDAAAQRQAERQRKEEELDDLDDDEFADFLVDDEEGDKPGEPRRRRRALARALPTGVSAEAFQEAQDIFGDADELLEEFRARPRFEQQEAPEDDEDLDAEDLGDDDEARAERLRAVEERRKAKEMKRITEKVEPQMLAKAMLRSEDDVIRTTDLPEREQLRPSPEPRGWKDPASRMLDDCAAWIHARLLPPVDSAAEDAQDGDRASYLRHAQALETTTLLTGFREVDGPSDSSDGLYSGRDLMEGVTNLSRGQRAVRDGRGSGRAEDWREDEQEQDNLRESIKGVLTEVFDRHNEVPFLAMYRKQLLGDLLCGRSEDMPDVIKKDSSRLPTGLGVGMVQAKHRRIRRWDILWRVADLAVQWRALARRQEARQAVFEQAMDSPEATQADRECLDGLLEMLKAAQSPEEVADIDAKYRLKMAASNGRLEDALEAVSVSDGRRRPGRRSVYETLLKTGLEPVVRKIYMRAEAFGESIDMKYRRDEVADIPLEPREFAAQYINPESGMGTPEAVLQKAAEMAMCELTAEPRVRQAVREPFLKRALVSTEPTPQGEQLLDPLHICGCVKRIRDKPVQSFTGSDTFLRIAQAEKEGLIEVRIAVDERVLDEDILQNMIRLYQSPNQNRISQIWDAIRADTLKKAVMDRLLPAFAVELRARLLAEARDAVLLKVSDKLWDWASQAPTQVQEGDESAVVEQRRFAAVCWGPGDPATTMVMLNEGGQLVDVLYCGQLSGAIRRTRRNAQGVDDIFADPSKSKDAERVRDFLVQHTPHKIFVGASCMQCGQLYEDLQKVFDHILDRMPSALTRMETGYIELGWADESLAALWETSEAALQEMGDQLPLVRRAIALGRCKLEPLAVLAALCGPSGEVLSMNLHPLRELLPRQALLTAAERVCITAVNQVGLDINVVAHSAWQAAPLQFIAGLGLRKAQLLTRTVQREQFLQTRLSLYKNLKVMDKTVFRNCFGFLRITASSEDADVEALDALDATRVSPTQYQLAKELARAILDAGGSYNAEDDIVLQAQARPNDVEGFNLQEFNRQLQEAERPDQLTLLRDITFELAAPAMELRRQRENYKTTEVFYMLCGESAESLKEGREVTAIVTFAGSKDVLLRLPDFGDAEGVLSEPASDFGNQQGQPRDRYTRDQAIRVRVDRLVDSASNSIVSKLSVVLVEEEDSGDEWERRYCQDIEPWYHILTREEREKAIVEKRRSSKGRQLMHRPIRHPNFKNLTALQATETMRDLEVGTCLFRPSSRGTDQITLTIKVHKRTDDGLGIDAYYHQEVREGPKGSAIGAHLKLGKPLEIAFLGAKDGLEQYEDLDEILARFAEPFVAHVKQIKCHRKYREGPWEHVKAQLVQEKQRQGAQGAAYVLGAKQESPGVFYLAFIINKTPQKEYMSVTPDGVYFRHEVQKTVEHVLREFKQRPYGDRALVASEDAAPPPPPPAARVNRFSAHAPGNPPGPPAVPTIKPAWITAKEFPQQQPQQQHQQQLLPPPWPQPPQLPLPQQPQMQRPPGSANGFSHNPPPPPPPPQQPVPGYSGGFGIR